MGYFRLLGTIGYEKPGTERVRNWRSGTNGVKKSLKMRYLGFRTHLVQKYFQFGVKDRLITTVCRAYGGPWCVKTDSGGIGASARHIASLKVLSCPAPAGRTRPWR